MDFTTSETQQDLAGLTRRIVDDQLSQTRLRAVDAAPDHVDRELWSALGAAGVLAAALPESAGGGGYGLLEQCSVLIELGRGVAPVPYLGSIVLGAAAIATFGDDVQRAAWAVPAAQGELILTAALTEDLAEPPDAPLSRAEPADAGWVLSGAKAVVPAGPIADLFLVPASTAAGPRVFLVRPDDAGVSVEPEQLVDGDRAASLELVGVALGADRLLGGAEVLDWLVTRATVGICAQQLGVLERALELTAAYARERVQFGRPIGSFQAVAQRLADAYIDVEAVRLTTWEAAWRLHEGLPASTELATAKFWAADAGHRVAHTAVHVHGGTGIDVDGAVHRYFVAAKRNEFTLGAATAQLRRLGAELAATPA
jgi:alkylation response protein AidB-like acyl-CoA dehydrogenase